MLSNVGRHYYVDRKTKRIDKIQKANYNSIMMNYKSINKNESGANSKELNVLTSYRLNDFKKKAGATHVDMSANIRRDPRHNWCCGGDDNSDAGFKLQKESC